MLGEITNEIKETYEVAQRWKREPDDRKTHAAFRAIELSDALRDQLAAKLKAEFERDHLVRDRDGENPWWIAFSGPQTGWSDSDWQAEARRLLGG